MPVSHHDWIAHHAARRPDAVAVVDLAGDRSLGYREFDRRIAGLAGHLRDACGIGPGARVALLAQNGTDLLEVQFACWRLGAIFVPLNWRLALPELDASSRTARPRCWSTTRNSPRPRRRHCQVVWGVAALDQVRR